MRHQSEYLIIPSSDHRPVRPARSVRVSVFGAKPNKHDTRVKVQVFEGVSEVVFHGCPDVHQPTRKYWQFCTTLLKNTMTCLYIYRYSFSMALNDLATMGRMSLVRSLQLGIALETAHQFSPWWGSASTHRCITLSCWAWRRKNKKQYIQD